MSRKHLLLIFFATLIATTAITIRIPTTIAQVKGTIAVSPLIIDTRTLKQIGQTFSINITIANVDHLWGYQYKLSYNASVINVTNYVSLEARFQKELPSEIKSNYTAVSRGTFDADPVGITTVTPIPVDRIDFVVTGNGTTGLILDPKYQELANVYGQRMESQVVSGKFSNVKVLEIHDVGVNQASVSKTSGAPGDSITITATVANKGGFIENVTVKAKYNQTQIETSQTITNLAINGSQTLTFTWDTANLASGIYIVTVEATAPIDDDASNNSFIAGTVTLTAGGEGGIPIQIIYIGAAIGVIIIVIIAVFALRARKP